MGQRENGSRLRNHKMLVWVVVAAVLLAAPTPLRTEGTLWIAFQHSVRTDSVMAYTNILSYIR